MHITPTWARRALAGLGVLAGLAGTGAALAQPAAVASDVREIEAAHATYERGQWPEAYAGFARLADRGNPEAARIAWLMLRHGARLYGQGFEATPYQELYWGWLQQCIGGCGAPEHVLIARSGC